MGEEGGEGGEEEEEERTITISSLAIMYCNHVPFRSVHPSAVTRGRAIQDMQMDMYTHLHHRLFYLLVRRHTTSLIFGEMALRNQTVVEVSDLLDTSQQRREIRRSCVFLLYLVRVEQPGSSARLLVLVEIRCHALLSFLTHALACALDL